jgi:hypothetical protein
MGGDEMKDVNTSKGVNTEGGDFVAGNKNVTINQIIMPPNEIKAERQPLPPAGELPEPGDLPPGSRLRFPVNALFTGRELELKAAAGALFYLGNSALPVVVSGVGGCGKSQMAVELAYRYGPYLDGVHWLNAAGSLESEVARETNRAGGCHAQGLV